MFSTTSENYWMFMNIVQHTNWTTPINPVFCRGYVNQYFDNKEEDVHKDTFRQIAIDVPRMSPLVGLFQQRLVQEMVERILYIWAIRSPPTHYFVWKITKITERRLWKYSFLTLWCVSLYIFTIYNPCIWTVMCRHPASGYVQGINDLVTPFLMVFLQVIAIFTYFLNIEKCSSMHLSLWRTLWRWM